MAANKNLTCLDVARKLKKIAQPTPGVTYMVNRNPRNLELLKIGYKPSGYHLEQPGRCFWHKLVMSKGNKSVTAQVVHFEAGVVLQACTSEWALKKHLYRQADTSAYINLGRVFAQRCLEAGILEMDCTIEPTPDGKLAKFLDIVQNNGIALKESERYVKRYPWEQHRMEKPWELEEK